MVEQRVTDGDLKNTKPIEAPKISFGVKRKEEKKLQTAPKAVIDVEVDSDEERERDEAEREAKRRKLTHFDDGAIVGEEDRKKEVVVIPMVVEHDWRTQKLLDKEKEGTLTDEERAKLALLNLSSSDEVGESANGAAKIVVDENSEKPNVEDADYSAVSIEQFGLAILRGCNWKDGDGIGKNPQKVTVKLPARRPHGLGLGATPKAPSNGKAKAGDSKKEEAVGEINAGSCIKIIDGRHKGTYGKVEARDDDSNSFFIRTAIGSKSIKVSQFVVEAVTSKEYERDSKCLNKANYDRERQKIEERNSKYESKTEKYQSKASSSKKYEDEPKRSEELWARTDLLVRFVDPDYKHGKLFKQKVRIVDVAGRRDITIEDDRRNTYYQIRQSWLETVIPRNIGDKIMIVGGKRKGKLGVMLDKDKEKEKVTVKLPVTDEVVKAYFEDVCAVSIRNEDDYD
ncbi:unnamed protein product [Caenorhabditis bovis]|uniref:G-patch domain-containing protein n=1 Tax=Caenorhabditis bovis TaxID=2654633 RepID=A0A8S1F9N4_9PELO|nr:unnamed protein product [Caenorhabditis bovis]